MIHQKKKGLTGRPKSGFKSRQSYSSGNLPYHCSFYYLVHARCLTWRVNLSAASNLFTARYAVGAENEDESMDQEQPHQNEAGKLAALWGKLRHWAG